MFVGVGGWALLAVLGLVLSVACGQPLDSTNNNVVSLYYDGEDGGQATVDNAFMRKGGAKAETPDGPVFVDDLVAVRNFTIVINSPELLDNDNFLVEVGAGQDGRETVPEWYSLVWLDSTQLKEGVVIGHKSVAQVRYDASKVGGGNHAFTLALRFTRLSEEIPLWTKNWKRKVNFNVEAQPDARYSKLMLDAECLELEWSTECIGSIDLKDSSGKRLPNPSGFVRQVKPMLSSKKDKLAADSTQLSAFSGGTTGGDQVTDNIQFRLYGEKYGVWYLRVYIYNVLVSVETISVECGSKGEFSPEEEDCVCAEGFRRELKFNVMQCVECAICKPGQVLLSPKDSVGCTCEDCPPGSYCPDQFRRLSCPKGTYCPRGSFEPVLCRPDEFMPNDGANMCNRCEASVHKRSSTFGRSGSTSRFMCSLCPANGYCNSSRIYNGLEQLLDLPNEKPSRLLSVSDPQSRRVMTSEEDLMDYYDECAQRGTIGFLEKQYDAAITSGVSNLSLTYVSTPKPGYYRFPTLKETGGSGVDDLCASVSFLACPGGAESCMGGEDSLNSTNCGPGYAGFLCMGCDEGFAFVDGECRSCDDSSTFGYAFAASITIIIVTLAMTWQSIRKFSAQHKKRLSSGLSSAASLPSSHGDASLCKSTSTTNGTEKKPRIDSLSAVDPISLMTAEEQLRSTTVVSVMKIAWSHLQVTSLILAMNVDWHESVKVVGKFSELLSFSSTSLTGSVVCGFDSDESDGSISQGGGFYAKVLLIFAFPLISAAIFGVIWTFLMIFRRCREQLPRMVDYFYGWQFTQMVFLFLAHLLLVRTALELFVCTSEVQERSFLVADPRIECFQGSHTLWFVVGGFGGLLIYGAGIPWASFYMVTRKSNTFLTAFLCKSFKADYVYWESVVVIRKVALTIFFLTLEKYGPHVQGLVTIPTLFVALYFQLTREPYAFKFLNQLETTGIICAITTLTLALYSLSFDEEIDLTLNITIAVLNGAYVLFIAYELVMLGCIFASKGSVSAGSRRESLDLKRSSGRLSSQGPHSAKADEARLDLPVESPSGPVAQQGVLLEDHDHQDPKDSIPSDSDESNGKSQEASLSASSQLDSFVTLVHSEQDALMKSQSGARPVSVASRASVSSSCSSNSAAERSAVSSQSESSTARAEDVRDIAII